ncbi:AfsR/SARP family transcriptional regulator [Actinoplanes flavus]|uniref:Tetratricopeptide repeat protein n=1 Tax=Actinoplanes flavus TaxID=2820290 RepID=A0ABS3UVR9_9ACTN|nr:BTAD domain-containing putative transcriptional regulator [Actinoplanes flavus]MBO3742682.1 tetratricopeptide repeat protein [Actinoplanes flavus]
MIEFRLLGEVQLRASGRAIAPGPLKQRTVLAALLVDAGSVVPTETLIDRVWDDSPPAEARNVLYTYLARLRRILLAASPDAPALRRKPGGYLFDADPELVDLHVFRRLAAQAREHPDGDPARLELLRQAVEQWHGEPLAGLSGEWVDRLREGIRQQIHGVLADWADAEIGAGRYATVVDRLSPVVDSHPLAEPLILRLIRGLHLDGRRTEALERYDRSRRHLADELGIDPSPETQELHQRILRGDPQRPAPPEPPEPAEDPVAVPGRQLPVGLDDFTGCEPEIAQVLTTLGSRRGEDDRQVVVVTGPGGIGKTSFSVHLANLLRPVYPDGQILVGSDGRDGHTGELVDRVLRALGVADTHRLTTIEDKAARYRATIRDRRLLIIIDNAAGAAEIRPLVPGVPGTALIVSSRARLTTVPRAEHVELRLFSRDESLTLLRRIISPERVAREPEAAAELAAMCAGLPLALRIVAARLAARPHWRITRLLDRMRDERRRLDEMAVDGLAVRICVGVGYEGLPPAVRQGFRLLGFLGCATFTEWTAAALFGRSVDDAADLLEHLFDARLVEIDDCPVDSVVRYRMHELVRLYARERALAEDDQADLTAAVRRTVVAATELVDRMGESLPFAIARFHQGIGPATGVDPSVLHPDSGGADWLATEADALVTTVVRAAETGLVEEACVLADAMVYASFGVNNDFGRWNRAHHAAHTAARASGNRVAEAVMSCGVGLLRYKEDRFDDAERHFTAAIDLFGQVGHEHGHAAAISGLGTVLREVGRNREAVPMLERALPILERVGDRAGAAHATYCLGHSHRELGNDDQAMRYLERATTMYRSAGHWRGEAIAVRGIGLIHRARGDLDAAELWCARAHDMVLHRSDPLLACYTAQSLAKVWIRQGRPERAAEPLHRGLRLCVDAQDRFGAALLRRTLGEMHLAAGRAAEALQDLFLAYAVWTELHHELGRARTLRDIGAAHALAGDCGAAHQAWQSAYATFSRLGIREAGEMHQWTRRSGCFCELSWLSGNGAFKEDSRFR